MSNFFKKVVCSISILFVLVLILISGCGNSASGRVSGVVTLDGKVLPNAAINFYPVESGSPAVGMTDSSGRYELAISNSMKGVVPGNYKITISTLRSGQESYGVDNTSTVISAVPEYIAKKLTDPATTDLFKEVKSGRQEINFNLQSKSESESE
ncbi:MAG: carboxypeptidase-like regulatory domain-containing protein [Planctomycetaceae bacterium]|jgi:uncharacterized membrane protein|nr:carboxypeptidase-like regulatory domain-containing protein [Planctomycetaceae bacterium]